MDPQPPIQPESTPQTILFRPTKKRKIYRRQHDSESSFDNNDAPPAPSPAPEPSTSTLKQTLDELIASPHGTTDESVEGAEVPIAEVLRLRKQRQRSRIGGVEFRASAVGGSARGGNGDDGEGDGEGGRELVVRGEGEVAEVGQVRKFAPQTGMIGDVSNKHMMAYIDSELAKRSSIHNSTTTTKHTNNHSSITPATNSVPNIQQQKPDPEQVNRQPATLGKLQEIDLGDEARDRNVQRTNQAWRRLAGEEIDEDEEGKDGNGNVKNGKKVRLGRDGKPWRGGRKRRASEDVKRDQIVEAILRENRLEIYDEPVIKERAANDDQAADDRIAEEFRREFMDAIQQRQTKKAAPAPAANRGPGGKVEEELMKGPKLGGSRQARAAMRESMLKNMKK